MDFARLKRAMELMYLTLDIPFALYDGAQALNIYPENRKSASLIISGQEPISALNFDRLLLNSPQHEQNHLGESFIILNMEDGIRLLIGPYSQEKHKDNRLKRLIGKVLRQNELKKHLKSLPYLASEKAFYVGEMLNLMLFEEKMRSQNEVQSPVESKLIKDAVEYISLNLYEKLSASLIANELNVHPDYLSSRFKKETGMAMMVYIQRERALLACRMLKSSSKSIAEIAKDLQFSSASRFTDVFKRHIGTSPMLYRDLGVAK